MTIFSYKTNNGSVAQIGHARRSAVDSNLEWISEGCLHKGYEWGKLSTTIIQFCSALYVSAMVDLPAED